jgi:predicted  nucleic acid-binding Zn-ribbon protein
MIEKLLEYQKLDKKRIEILRAVEGGRVKQELNTANKTLNDARAQLLSLEEDAKNLVNVYDNASRVLHDLLDKSKKINIAKDSADDDEIQKSVADANALLQKINTAEGQIEQIAKGITNKTRAFEDVKAAVTRAQTTIKALTPQHEKQLEQIKPQLDTVDAEMQKIAKEIDKTLLEKYKNRRRTESGGRATDIVIPLNHNRCSGCRVEMPLNLIHNIDTKGYIICEECGKIIFKE